MHPDIETPQATSDEVGVVISHAHIVDGGDAGGRANGVELDEPSVVTDKFIADLQFLGCDELTASWHEERMLNRRTDHATSQTKLDDGRDTSENFFDPLQLQRTSRIELAASEYKGLSVSGIVCSGSIDSAPGTLSVPRGRRRAERNCGHPALRRCSYLTAQRGVNL